MVVQKKRRTEGKGGRKTTKIGKNQDESYYYKGKREALALGISSKVTLALLRVFIVDEDELSRGMAVQRGGTSCGNRGAGVLP